MRVRDSQSGQASVELVALLPLIAVVALASWQVVVTVQAWSLAGRASRAAARAVVVGADPQRAARAALPGGWAARARVRLPRARDAAGRVEVALSVPLVVSGVRLADVRASAGLAEVRAFAGLADVRASAESADGAAR